MKILAVVGKSNNGKTTVIKKVMLKLLELESDFVVISEKNKDNKTVIEEMNKNWVGTGAKKTVLDKKLVFRYKDQFNVGITTLGDGANVLEPSFEKFEEYNCQVVMCAAHETNKIFDFLEKKSDDVEYEYKFKVRKTDPQEIDKENDIIAKKLFKWFIRAIEECKK